VTGLPSADARASALIVAIEHYDCDLYPRLDSLAAASSELAEALAFGGIVNAFPQGSAGGSSRELAERIRSWFAAAGSDERLILHWSGHGRLESGSLYLVTRESPPRQLDQTNAVEPRFLAKSAASSNARKVLIVVDVCFAGAALAEVIGTIASIFGLQAPNLGAGRGIAVLASAHALQKAQVGIVSGVLKEVLTGSRAARRWSDEDRFIDWDRLFATLEDAIGALGHDQRMVPVTFGSTFELIPNPRYRPGMAAEVFEERSWRLAQSDAVLHFGLAARGIEVAESGWFFAGRTRLLSALVSWLTTAESGVRIVTGPPGAGKSAVLGRLATLSDPDCRAAAIAAGHLAAESDDTVPPQGIIDVAVHAKGKTLDACVRALAEALAVTTGTEATLDVDAFVAAVRGIDRRLTILIDAVDEAADGQGASIASRLIGPLGRLARVRVLVGSRRSLDGAVASDAEDRHDRLRAAFGNAIIDDLADETDTGADIADYVRRRLADAISRHRDDISASAAAAARIATRADGIFLYARIVSRTLQEQDRLDGPLPATAIEAFVSDLQARFGDDRHRVDDLLAALAWGEGQGLTRRVWPAIANALATADHGYDDDDVSWSLGHAGWHIIESGVDGQAVYRLTHQILVDHYRGKRDDQDFQGRIVAALTRGMAGAAWLESDRYVWRHLADHAAKAGLLGTLIRDPGFLAVAAPAGLSVALRNLAGEDERRIAGIYDRVVDRLWGRPPLDRLPLIELTAQMEEPDLAPLLAPPTPTRWRGRWARVRPTSPHRIIARHLRNDVSTVAFGRADGCEVILARFGDTARLWRAATGEPIGQPMQGVTGVALGSVDGRSIVVSGFRDGTIRRWDAGSGTLIGEPFAWPSGWISAIALDAGRSIVACGHEDMTIRRWDARSGAAIGAPLEGHFGRVTSVALGVDGGRAIIASGSEDQTVRLWDAGTGEALGVPLRGHHGRVSAVALARLGDRTIVVSAGWDATIRVWDVRSGEAIGEPLTGHGARVLSVALAAVDESVIVASGSEDKTIRLWDVSTGQPVSPPFEGHGRGVSAVALGLVDSRPTVASGSWDQTIRVWDAAAIGTSVAGADRYLGSVRSVAFGWANRRSIVASGGDRSVRVWDALTGEAIGPPDEHAGLVTYVACGIVDRRPVIVSGDDRGAIRLSDGPAVRPPSAWWRRLPAWTRSRPPRGLIGRHERAVSAVAVGMIDRRPAIVSGGNDHAIQLWDARRGGSIGAPLQSRWVNCLAMGALGGRPIVVSGNAGHLGTISFWDARTRQQIGEPLPAAMEAVLSVAFGMVGSRPVVVSGGHGGEIYIWDARTRETLRLLPEGHKAPVNCVAVGRIGWLPAILSGGGDGTIRLWDAVSGAQHLVIDIGSPILAMDLREDLVAVGLERGLLTLAVADLRETTG